MATVTAAGNAFTTTAGNKTVVATPAANDLIVVVCAATGVATTALTDNNADGLGNYTQVDADRTGFSTTGHLSVWVRNALVGSATSTTWTATQTSSTGGGLVVYRISGMSRTGPQAVRGSGGQSAGTLGTTPAPVLGQAALTGNPVIGAVANGTSPATMTPRSSPAYTEDADVGYSTPTTGLEAMHVNSGETSATITWGSTSATAFASIAVELDTSATPSVVPWSVVQSNSGTLGNVSTGSVTLAATPTTGNKILVAIGDDGGSGSTVTSIVDGNSNALTRAWQVNNGTTSYGALYFYDVPATPSATFTVTMSAFSDVTMLVQEVSGLAAGNTTAAALDGTAATTTGAASPANTTAYSTAAVNEYLVVLATDTGAGNQWGTPTNGFTVDPKSINSSSASANQLAYKPSSGLAEFASWSYAGASNHWDLGIVAFKAGPLVLRNNAEEGSNGTTVTTGNSAGTGENAFDAVNIGASATAAYDNTHTAHGSLAFEIATGATSTTSFLEWNTSFTNPATRWFRMYLYVTANPAAQHRIFNLLAGATQVGNVLLKTNGALIFTNAAGGTVLTSSAIPLNQWIRLEGFVTGSATVGQWEYKIWYTADSAGTPDDTQTSAASQSMTGTPTVTRFGIGAALASVNAIWLDDLGLSDTGYIGPAAPLVVAPPVPPAPRLTVPVMRASIF